MSIIIWTGIVTILYFVYKFQLNDLGKGHSLFIASIEASVLSLLLMSSSGELIVIGSIGAPFVYWFNNNLQKFLQS